MVTIEIIKPAEPPFWSEIYFEKAETLSRALSSHVIYSSYVNMSETVTHLYLYFNTKNDFDDYLQFRETIPEYQLRETYEREHNTTRTIIFQEYVNNVEWSN